METFGEIFEDFWTHFCALIRAVRAVRVVRAARVVRADRVIRAVRAVSRVIRAVGAQVLYKESGELFKLFWLLLGKKEDFVSTRVVGFAATKNSGFTW